MRTYSLNARDGEVAGYHTLSANRQAIVDLVGLYDSGSYDADPETSGLPCDTAFIAERVGLSLGTVKSYLRNLVRGGALIQCDETIPGVQDYTYQE